jgi:hypothetical protein
MMSERGLHVAHTTILRWVRRYAPEFIKRCNRFVRSAGRSWRVDDAYITVRGEWTHLYRAVDKAGQTVDFRLSSRRMWQPRRLSSSRRSDTRTGRHTRSPWTATQRRTEQYARCERTDYDPSARSCDLPNISTPLSNRTIAGSSSEPDRCFGFKSCESAPITIAGIELLRRIHKGQFALSGLRLKGQAAPTIWNAVLAA